MIKIIEVGYINPQKDEWITVLSSADKSHEELMARIWRDEMLMETTGVTELTELKWRYTPDQMIPPKQSEDPPIEVGQPHPMETVLYSQIRVAIDNHREQLTYAQVIGLLGMIQSDIALESNNAREKR